MDTGRQWYGDGRCTDPNVGSCRGFYRLKYNFSFTFGDEHIWGTKCA
jgi:hypothetical protein